MSWGPERIEGEIERNTRELGGHHKRIGGLETVQANHTSEISVLQDARTDIEGDIESVKTELGERFQSLSRNIWQATGILVTIAIAVLGILKLGG
jgi:hypothetical protein